MATANNETWGLKLDQELKDKINSIIKGDFNNSKEFMEHIVALYEVDKMKQAGCILTDEIEEMETLSRRMYNVLVNANEKVNTVMISQRNTLELSLNQRQNIIDTLQRSVAELKEENESISQSNDDLVNINNEYSQRVNQLTDSASTSAALIAEYKDKNQVLMKQIEDMSKFATEIEKLNTTINKLTDDNNSLQSLINVAELKCSSLSSELENTKVSDEIALKSAIIKLKQQHQSEIEDMQNKYRAEIDQYQEKYRKLLGKLERPNKKNNSHNPK